MRKKVNAINKARTAMAIDCEGNISLYMYISKEGYPLISAHVGFVNACKALLEYVYKIWEVGHIRRDEYQDKKDTYEWQIRKRDDVEWLLKSIKKYLIVKQRQATLVLEAISFLNECRPRKWGGKKSRYTSADKERIKEFAMLSRVLNARGKEKD